MIMSMTRAPFVVHLNRSDTRVKRMTDFAGRLKALLDRPKVQADDYLRQALDDFLGAIYGLALADVQGFTDRAPGTTPQPDKVQIRAEDAANGKVRLDGKW